MTGLDQSIIQLGPLLMFHNVPVVRVLADARVRPEHDGRRTTDNGRPTTDNEHQAPGNG
jgi:hypothetical protein